MAAEPDIVVAVAGLEDVEALLNRYAELVAENNAAADNLLRLIRSALGTIEADQEDRG